MEEFKIECREDVIRFMQEMMVKFSEDHVSNLMKKRRVKRCEELAEKYTKDGRFNVVAKYLIEKEKFGINATIEDFKTDEPLMNIMMFFYCFEDHYGNKYFNESYILDSDEYLAYIDSLAESDSEVAKEVAILLGKYINLGEDKYWNLTELTMQMLINSKDSLKSYKKKLKKKQKKRRSNRKKRKRAFMKYKKYGIKAKKYKIRNTKKDKN